MDLGVIRGFYTDIDPVAVGLPLQAMISRRRRRRYPDVPDLRASARGGAHLERPAQRAMIAGCQTLMGLL
ncbi:AsnC family transcriptional regulator [Mycobacterium tuberculosis]|nr:AsnC family transcriptional regulator [Mycobacterium tuberculosis]